MLVGGAILAGCESTPPTSIVGGTPGTVVFQDTSRTFEERVDDLAARMTLEEKISQMGSESPAIPRLGIPAYNWWSEALHGVARAGTATVFPQAIGLAATWNTGLMRRIAEAVSDEGRAKYHENLRNNRHELYGGLTFFSPNVNIFRDPRWGRGQETYGEDPYLTGRLAVEFIRGMQGDDPTYLKTVTTAKHYAVHSGPERERHFFNAVVSPRDLRMTYLPAFEACVTEAKTVSVMTAYNRVNGEASSASPILLKEILRGEWGFEGYVVSDCGAVDDIYSNHLLAKSAAEAAAMAVKAGCDLECGCTYGIACDYNRLGAAVEKGLLTEAEIDIAVKRLFRARFRLGMFDPDGSVPYASIPPDTVDSAEHRTLALEAARQSLVLLKNEGGLLPLDPAKASSIAVIGPNADDTLVLTGNYMGTPAEPVSILAGLRALAAGANVTYAPGCRLTASSEEMTAEAVKNAADADIAVVVLGLTQQLEGEEGQTEGNPPGIKSMGDRITLNLTPAQEDLLEAVSAVGKPVVLVLLNGSALAVNWAEANIPAILEAWYPGQAGGTAVAEALFGRVNPAGRLPVTFYRSESDLPPFGDYGMENRTYRYFGGRPLYRFGFGLSYTTFTYRNLRIEPAEVKAGGLVTVTVEVENTGTREGDEVAQCYLRDSEASLPVPRIQLAGFARIRLAPGERETVRFEITARQMSFADDDGKWILEPGDFDVWAAGQSPDFDSYLTPENEVSGKFTVVK
jgi:beta-glucosidase